MSALQTALETDGEKEGYLKSEFGEATAMRGGKRKRYFKVTKTGKAALDYSKETRMKLWSAIPDVSFEYVKSMDKQRPSPPSWSTKFLAWFLKEDYYEDVQGDLEEEFQIKANGSSGLYQSQTMVQSWQIITAL